MTQFFANPAPLTYLSWACQGGRHGDCPNPIVCGCTCGHPARSAPRVVPDPRAPVPPLGFGSGTPSLPVQVIAEAVADVLQGLQRLLNAVIDLATGVETVPFEKDEPTWPAHPSPGHCDFWYEDWHRCVNESGQPSTIVCWATMTRRAGMAEHPAGRPRMVECPACEGHGEFATRVPYENETCEMCAGRGLVAA